jgi:hypothetical protein
MFLGEEMKKTLSTMTNIVGAVALVYAGYIMLRSIPELGRYMKMRAM